MIGKQTVFSIALLCGTLVSAQAQTNGKDAPKGTQDTLLNILRDELRYDMEALKKQETAPFYMSLRVEDTRQNYIASSFGAISKEADGRIRFMVPQIRVGSKELDNFKYNTQGAIPKPGQNPRANEAIRIPINNAGMAIRQIVWAEVMKRYDYAVQVWQQNKIKAQTQVADEDKAPCFSDAPVEKYYEEQLTESQTAIDTEVWRKKLNRITAVFKGEPLLRTGTATLTFDVVRTYMVNSDGTEIVQNCRTARVMLSASMKADDGMNQPLHEDFFAFSPDKLPSVEVMEAKARDMVVRLKALRNAPVADPYTGPAILSGAASGVFFHEIFGHRLEGHRLKTGGQTFKKMVGEKVLPETFQVYCDPTLTEYADVDLNGHYLYDDEGVKARRVDNVVNGVLKSFLMNRVPLDGFPESNGHGRASGGNDPVSRQSNLIVETLHPYSEIQLRDMLKAEAKKQGKEYGYYYKTVTSGYTLTGEGGSLNSFNVTPLEVYRVFVDGRPDELVRGVNLIGTPLAMFSNIAAAGDTPSVFTGSCGAESGWVPVTACSPMIFATKIETQRRAQSREIQPVLPAPQDSAGKHECNGDNTDKVILDAMQDELERNKEGLLIPGGEKPCYMAFTASRWRDFQITATLGGTVIKQMRPWHMDGTSQVITGDLKNTSEVQEGTSIHVYLPAEVDYDLIRRNFWGAADYAYQYALMSKAQKDAYIAGHPKPTELQDVPDMQPVAGGEVMQERERPYNFDVDKLEEMVKLLSAEFAKYPKLFGTKVTVGGLDMNLYRVNTEGLRMKQPKGSVSFTAHASARTEDGEQIGDVISINVDTPNDLPSFEVLKEKVNNLAKTVLEEVEAPQLLTSYEGPVAFQGDGVCLPFAVDLMRPGNGVVSKDFIGMNKPGLEEKLGKEVIDKKLTVKNIPSMKEHNGMALTGHYDYDAEGQKAQETVIVENGVFRNALCGLYPMPKFPATTASTALGYATPQSMLPFTAPGVVKVEVEKGLADEQMKKQLIKAAKAQQQKHVFIVKYLDGASSLLVYAIDVKTGAETMMKTGGVAQLSMNDLKSIRAVSAADNVVNNQYKGSNLSVIAPKWIVLDKFTIPKAQPKTAKQPSITNPTKRQ